MPTRSLNLPDNYMYDGWLDRFSYAVIADLAVSSGMFNDYSTSTTTGVIQILDANGTQVTDTASDTVVAYAIISHGKDTKGAITRAGQMPIVCGATTKDDENCDGDDVFVDARIADSTIPANYYDDIVRWKVRHFMAPLKGDANLYNSTCAPMVNGGQTSYAMKDNCRIYVWGDNMTCPLIFSPEASRVC